MDFENAFSRHGKVVDFRENGLAHGILILVQKFYAV